MKKVFLLSLGLVLGIGAFAQNRVMKNDLKERTVTINKTAVGTETTTEASAYAPMASKSVVVNRYEDMDDAITMWTYYDLQSNSWCSNRMYQLPTGEVGVVATFSHQDNTTVSDRGTGYNFYNGSEWGDEPEERVESMKTGWPTIAQYGETGEILLSHSPIRCWIRETAGEGEWVYMSELPWAPDGFPYTDDNASWPRVATSGDNHNIIHVIADIQHSDDAGNAHHYQVYYRSTDAVNWTCEYSPLAADNEEYDHYTADAYSLAANGHNVAMVYSDDLQSNLVMYKSTNDGQTWERTVIWENPYYGYDWETDPASIYTDTLFGPCNVSVAIDNNGTAHVAMNTWEFWHTELGTSVSYFYGRGVDGIRYWNENMEAPIQAPDHNPHHALRLWWPTGDGYVHMENDSTIWIGYVPMYEGSEWNNDYEYLESEYWYKTRGGASSMPVLSCDPDGNLACAFISQDVNRTDGNHYFRSIYVSYYNVAEGFWYQVEDNLMEDFMLMYSEAMFPISVLNTYNSGEYWFGYQEDDQIGFFWGSQHTQTDATENNIHAIKIIANPEYLGTEETAAQDIVYSVYPNPATDHIVVSSAMNGNATITFVNLAGQTVKSFNKALNIGENNISIDLESGVYFCTINANGFNKTTKVIVK